MQFYRKHVNFERKLGFGRPYTPNPICFYRNLVFHFNKTFSKGEKVTHNKIHTYNGYTKSSIQKLKKTYIL